MHAQGLNSSTFTAVPLDSSLTLPQLLDRQFVQSPEHTAYIYDAAEGGIVSISLGQYIRSVYATCRRILRDTVPHTPVVNERGIVIGILAATDAISYCMMVAAIMRAGFVPFCISPRNAVDGVAKLLENGGAAVVYVSTDLKQKLADALEICGKQLPVFDVLTFDELQAGLEESSESEPLPVLPRVVDMDGVALILHSSGSTSTFSKPIYLSHKIVMQYAFAPLSGSQDYCGQISSVHMIASYHGMGVFALTWPLAVGLIMAVLRPAPPPMASSPEKALAGILATKPDIVLSSPAAIESWSEDPAGLRAMQALKVLAFSGAPLNKRVGDNLVDNGVVLWSMYGTNETGLLNTFCTPHGNLKDWEYFSVREGIDAARMPEEDGSTFYTFTYLNSPSYKTCYSNVEIEGRRGCQISDLLEQHPDNPDLHRVFARKDEIISLSIAAKMNPVVIEAQINRNPFVNAALVFGTGRPHPGVLIQLKPECQTDLLDDGKRSEILDALWVSVDAANRTSPIHFQIPRKMVLLADPEKPFALTSKSQPRRRAVLEDYDGEISAAYL
ncbi:Acetyl-CoA synthetase-like protein [Mycena sanguinolenta]|uniref:Acetyl-CoA synthetase-like protein n=1 Tax=Mycena sanguinolenta TaxID=230812 RepID=A0A8H6YG17_9AGAR|nr:Acetyl-CoA synthetase-like protein [Mycena sanguinolenta]